MDKELTIKNNKNFLLVSTNKKGTTLRHPLSLWGGRSVSNRQPPEPQSKE